MLLDYYNNVSSLHSSIRSMRHDLSNHLAALSFMSMGESAADPDRQTLMSTSGVAGESEETGGCTPPVDPRRCAEASRRASCGAGALCAPDDPGRFATGVPGDAFCGYSTPVIPGDSNDSRDAYLRSLLDACSEIETDRLSSREKYEIYHYIMTVIDKHRIPASALSISVGAYGSVTEIAFSIHSDTGTAPSENSNKRRKPLHLLLLRHDMMFRLIKILAASHGGSATWKKTGGVFTLSLTIPDQQ